jgi:hypothetical protein
VRMLGLGVGGWLFGNCCQGQGEAELGMEAGSSTLDTPQQKASM